MAVAYCCSARAAPGSGDDTNATSTATAPWPGTLPDLLQPPPDWLSLWRASLLQQQLSGQGGGAPPSPVLQSSSPRAAPSVPEASVAPGGGGSSRRTVALAVGLGVGLPAAAALLLAACSVAAPRWRWRHRRRRPRPAASGAAGLERLVKRAGGWRGLWLEGGGGGRRRSGREGSRPAAAAGDLDEEPEEGGREAAGLPAEGEAGSTHGSLTSVLLGALCGTSDGEPGRHARGGGGGGGGGAGEPSHPELEMVAVTEPDAARRLRQRGGWDGGDGGGGGALSRVARLFFTVCGAEQQGSPGRSPQRVEAPPGAQGSQPGAGEGGGGVSGGRIAAWRPPVPSGPLLTQVRGGMLALGVSCSATRRAEPRAGHIDVTTACVRRCTLAAGGRGVAGARAAAVGGQVPHHAPRRARRRQQQRGRHGTRARAARRCGGARAATRRVGRAGDTALRGGCLTGPGPGRGGPRAAGIAAGQPWAGAPPVVAAGGGDRGGGWPISSPLGHGGGQRASGRA